MEDIFYGISIYLNCKDTDNLLKLTKTYDNQKIIQQKIINKINEHINKIFLHDAADFKNLLKKTGSIISGSFLLQIILNEYWQDTDIDIYVPYCMKDYDVEFIEFFKKYELIYENHNTYNLCAKGIEYVNTYNVNNKIIQLIVVDCSLFGMYSYIISSFDYDFCKNVYGINKYKEYIRMHNFQKIIDKTDMETRTESKRYIKYSDRGFAVYCGS